MKLAVSAAAVVFALAVPTAPARAQAAPDSVALVTLLHQFLDGAGRDDRAMHDRFWADDLVYTGSSGRRIGKADILKDVGTAPPPKPEDPVTEYGAEQVRVRQYGGTAVVAFRLVATTKEKGESHVARYYNTGTFVKRAGKWQAVGWQATRIVPTEDEAHREVSMAETALRQALRTGEASAVEALTDPSFVWTRAGGAALTRAEVLDAVHSGAARHWLPAADSTAIATYGETAIARGVAGRKPTGLHPIRSAKAPEPGFDVTSVLTLLWRGGAWRAVSLETTGEEPAATR